MLSKMSIAVVAICLLLGTACTRSHYKKNGDSMMETQAPDFKAQDEQGAWRTLSEFRGNKVVLYFYPKDDTPGCTQQACSLRDSNEEFAENNMVVLGINYDSPASHKKFKEKYHLPFTLLSDPDGAIAKKYGATSLMYFVPRRVTFLIDEKGVIKKILDNVDPAHHAEDILLLFK